MISILSAVTPNSTGVFIISLDVQAQRRARRVRRSNLSNKRATRRRVEAVEGVDSSEGPIDVAEEGLEVTSSPR